jgi:tetratricopeptide (TPR) repeat protein
MKTRRYLAACAALLLAAAQAQTTPPLDAARAALAANDLASAEALLAPLTTADARDAAAFATLGRLRERQHNLKDAAAAWEQATRLDGTNPEYFSSLGIALSQRMGEMNFMQQALVAGKMKKAFEKSVALDAGHIPGLIGLARYYTNAPEIAGGSPEKAREFAGRVGGIVPFLGEIELGLVDEHEEKYPEALAHFVAAAGLDPANADAQNLAGRTLARLGRKEEARARFEAALKANPGLGSARDALAGLDRPAASP